MMGITGRHLMTDSLKKIKTICPINYLFNVIKLTITVIYRFLDYYLNLTIYLKINK